MPVVARPRDAAEHGIGRNSAAIDLNAVDLEIEGARHQLRPWECIKQFGQPHDPTSPSALEPRLFVPAVSFIEFRSIPGWVRPKR